MLPRGLSVGHRPDAYFGADGGSIGYASLTSESDPLVAVAVVQIEGVLFRRLVLEVGNVQIRESVVIKIPPGHASAFAVVIDEAASRDTRERAVAFVVI